MAHLSGLQPAGTHTPPLQKLLPEQLPQSSSRPQPSPTLPQYWALPPEVTVIGVQLGPPMQMPGAVAPPLQVASPAQAPQSSFCPLQPLPIVLQYVPPAGVQV